MRSTLFSIVTLLTPLLVAADVQTQEVTPPETALLERETLSSVVDVLDERGWQDITFGLMLERDIPAKDIHVYPRAHNETRDLVGGQVVDLLFNKGGDMLLPASVARHTFDRRSSKKSRGKGKHRKTGKSKSKASKSKSKSKKSTGSSTGRDLIDAAVNAIGSTFSARITWYTGHDLLNPSCVTHSKWNPTDQSMIAAVTIDWDGKPPCGSYLQLRPKDGKKAIIVRVVDSCGGCAAGTAHVDLTTSAFSQLYNLDIGLVNGIQVQKIEDPVSDYTSQAVAMYGPKQL